MRTAHCFFSLSIITQFLWSLTLAETYDGSIVFVNDKPIDKNLQKQKATSAKYRLKQAPLPDIELKQNENYFPEIEFPSSILDLHKPFYYNRNLYNVEDKKLFQNNLNVSDAFKLPQNFVDNYKRKQKLNAMNISLKKVSKALDSEYDDATNTNRNKGITNKGLRLQDNIRIKAYLDKNHITKPLKEEELPQNKNNYKGNSYKGMCLSEKMRIKTFLNKKPMVKEPEKKYKPIDPFIRKSNNSDTGKVEENRVNSENIMKDVKISQPSLTMEGNSENKMEDVQIPKPSLNTEENSENTSVDKESLLVIVDDLIAITEQMFNSVVLYVQEIEDTNTITDEETEEIVHVVENLKEVLDILDYLISNMTATHSDVDVNSYSTLLHSHYNASLFSNSSTSSNKTMDVSLISLPQTILIQDNNEKPTILPMIEAVDEAIDQIEVILNATVSNTDVEDITEGTNEVISLVENLKELLEIVEDLNRNITSISLNSAPKNYFEDIYNITSLFENYTLGVVEEITDDLIELEELNYQTNHSYTEYATEQKNTTTNFDSNKYPEALTAKPNEVYGTQIESPNSTFNNLDEAIDRNDTISGTEQVVDKTLLTEEVNDEI